MTEAPGAHSPDGRYWWTGNEWVPAWSPDARYWFNGAQWVLAAPPSPTAPFFRIRDAVLGLVWLTVAAVTTGFAMHIVAYSADGVPKHDWQLEGFYVLSGVLVLLMPVIGFVVCGAPRWFLRLLFAVGIICIGLAFSYGMTWTQSTDVTADNEAGAGLAMLAIPTMFVVGVLVAGGGVARLAVDALRSRVARPF